MKSLLLILIILTSYQVKSQLSGQARIDSLLKELPKMKEDTNAVNLLRRLSSEYCEINPDIGIKFGKQGLKLTEEIGWEIGKAKCYNSLAVNFASGKSEFPIALDYYLKALSIDEKIGNKKGIAWHLSNLGNTYKLQSNFPKALDYYLKSLKMYKELGDNKGIAINFGNIGVVYQYQSDYTKALEYYQKALNLNEELGRKSGAAINLGNIGVIYAQQYDYTKALEFFKKALKIFEKLGNKIRVALNLGNIGNIYYEQTDYPKALEYYHKALKIDEELGNKSGIARLLGNIGELYFNLSQDSVISKVNEGTELVSLNKEINLNMSIEYSLKSIKIYEEIGALDYRSNFLNNLSKAYSLKGDYKKAYEAFIDHKTLNDSVFNIDKAKDIANLEAKRENELKQKEIEILKAEKEKEKVQRYSMFGGIIGLGLVIALVMVQRRRSEKLLLNVLPATIAKRLKKKEHPIADHFENASIIFIDIVGFTNLSSGADPKRIVSVLNDIFTKFDELADQFGLEKIKTIGDAYMAVCGIPDENPNHFKQTALMALSVKQEMDNYKTSDGTEIKFRIGIDCGAVVAGVIGNRKFIYDLWSDAVNTASRMESTSESSKIQITENFKEELEKYNEDWNIEYRGEFEIKGKGLMKTYYLE